ncbi:MAG: hypothetical protein ACREX9_20860 [Gammaproteobacteria bacterium]
MLHEPIWNFRGALGVQVRHQDFMASGEEALTPPVVGRSVGVFLFEDRDWKSWHFEFGARRLLIRSSNGTLEYVASQYTVLV